MLHKTRTRSTLLKSFIFLNKRTNLTEEAKKYFSNLEKGYEGEVQFDLLTEQLTNDCMVINDLLVEVEKTNFQIDSVIIFGDSVYLFEIKNYKGDYVYESEYLRATTGREIKNPLDQLNRTKLLLRQLLKQHGFNFNIQAYVIFINPEFTLYQAPPNVPFIFPSQINTFFNKLNTKQPQLNRVHEKLANTLISLHQSDSSFNKLPAYEFSDLKKGITCHECGSFSLSVSGHFILCNECGCQEKIEASVLRNVEEVKLLYPEHKITTNLMHEWCVIIESKRRIRRILKNNFHIHGSGKGSNYE